MPLSFVRQGDPKVYLPGYKSISQQAYQSRISSLIDPIHNSDPRHQYGSFEPGALAQIQGGRADLNANQLVNLAVKAPAYALEAPLRLPDQLLGGVPGAIAGGIAEGIGHVPVLNSIIGGLGEGLRKLDYAGAGYANTFLAHQLSESIGKRDDEIIATSWGFDVNGGGFGEKQTTAGEVRKKALARWGMDMEGNAYSLAQLEERARNNMWDFGQFATSEDGLTDFGVRSLLNPLNLVFTPIAGAGAKGAMAGVKLAAAGFNESRMGAAYLEGVSRAASWARPIIKPVSQGQPYRFGYGYAAALGRGIKASGIATKEAYHAAHNPLPNTRGFVDVGSAARDIMDGGLVRSGYNHSLVQAMQWTLRGARSVGANTPGLGRAGGLARKVYFPGLNTELKGTRLAGDAARAWMRGGVQQELGQLGADYLFDRIDAYVDENDMENTTFGQVTGEISDVLSKLHNSHPLSDHDAFVVAAMFLPTGVAAREVIGAPGNFIRGNRQRTYGNNVAAQLLERERSLGSEFKNTDELFAFLGDGDKAKGQNVFLWMVDHTEIRKMENQFSHLTHAVMDADLDGLAARKSHIQGIVMKEIGELRNTGALQPKSTVDYMYELHGESGPRPGKRPKSAPGEGPAELNLSSTFTPTSMSMLKEAKRMYEVHAAYGPQLDALGLRITKGGILTREAMDAIIAHFDRTETFDQNLARDIIEMGPGLVHKDEFWREFSLTLGRPQRAGYRKAQKGLTEGLSREDVRQALEVTRETLPTQADLFHDTIAMAKSTGTLKAGAFQIKEPPYPMGAKLKANRTKAAGKTSTLATNERKITGMRDKEYFKNGKPKFGTADEVQSVNGTAYKRQSNGYYRRDDGIAVGIEDGAVRIVIPATHEADLISELGTTLYKSGPKKGQIKPGMEERSQALNLKVEQARMGVDEDALLLAAENGGRVFVASNPDLVGPWLADRGFVESARVQHRAPWTHPGPKPEPPGGRPNRADEPLPDYFSEEGGSYDDPGAMSEEEWIAQGGDAGEYNNYYETYDGPTGKINAETFASDSQAVSNQKTKLLQSKQPFQSSGHTYADHYYGDKREIPKKQWDLAMADERLSNNPEVLSKHIEGAIDAGFGEFVGNEWLSSAVTPKSEPTIVDDLLLFEKMDAEAVASDSGMMSQEQYLASIKGDPDLQPENLYKLGNEPLVLDTTTGKFATGVDDMSIEELGAKAAEYEKQIAAQDDYYARLRDWKEKIQEGVFRGDISYKDAIDAGWSPDRFGLQQIKPLPDLVYHAGTDIPGIRNLGMLTGTEVRDRFGPRAGLGGPLTNTTSFTTDPAIAERVGEVLMEAGMVTRGELTMSELADRARAGGFLQEWRESTQFHMSDERFNAAIRDEFKDYDLIPTEPTGRLAIGTEIEYRIVGADGSVRTGIARIKAHRGKRNYLAEDTIGNEIGIMPDDIVSPKGAADLAYKRVYRDMTEAEKRQVRYTMYRDFLQQQGKKFHNDVKHMNPLLVEPRAELMAMIQPENVQVYRARPRSPGAMGILDETEPYLKEWKLHPSSLNIEGVDDVAAYSFRGGDPHAIKENQAAGAFRPYRATKRIERSEKAAVGVARGDARRASLVLPSEWAVGDAVTPATSMFPEERLRTLQEHQRALRNAYKGEIQKVSEMDALAKELLPFDYMIEDMSLRDWLDPASPTEIRNFSEVMAGFQRDYPELGLEPSAGLIVDPAKDRFTMLQTNLNRWERLFMDYGPLSPIQRFYDAILAPKHARWLGKQAQNELHNQLALVGWDAGATRKFVTAMRKEVLDSKSVVGFGKLTGAHARPSIQALDEGKLRSLAQEIAPGDAQAVLERFGSYQKMITQASNRLLRSTEQKTRSGVALNPIEAAADAAFRTWQYAPGFQMASGAAQRFTKFTYPYLRFMSDPIFALMNWIEPYTYNIVNNGWRGRHAPTKQTERLGDLASAGLIPPGGLYAKDAPVELLLSDPGFHTIPANIRPNMLKEFEFKTQKEAELFFESIGKEHPIAATMRERFGDNVKDWAAEFNGMMATLVRNGPEHVTRKAYKEVLEKELGMSQAELKTLLPVAEALTRRYRGIYSSLADLYIGRMNRSNIERFANSYFIAWPISYMVKVTAWAYRVMFEKIGPVEGSAGAYLWDQWRQKYEGYYNDNQSFKDWVDDNPDFMFAMEMLAPITPASIGVSLNRTTRYVGNWVADEANLGPGMFGEYTPESVGDLVGGSFRFGPIRTATMANNILKGWEVPGFYKAPAQSSTPDILP